MFTSGRILSVQERRFRLLTTEGQVYLLTLARSAPLDESLLCDWRDTRATLEVQFSGEPNLVGGVAHAVHPAGRP